MELCSKCKRMTAEKNHYNGDIICYARDCGHVEKAGEEMSDEEKCSVCGEGVYEGDHDECGNPDCECLGDMVFCDHECSDEEQLEKVKPKFSIGEKVRVVKVLSKDVYQKLVGSIGVIEDIEEVNIDSITYSYLIGGACVLEEQLEKV